MNHVDLNCDLGEGFADDAKLMPLITSANIACGAHAGDERTMREVSSLALRYKVGIGAHPGYEDRTGFGRREQAMTPDAMRELVVRQIVSLRQICPVRHVKPHGALYNLAARDRVVAAVIADAMWELDRSLILFALAGSELVKAGRTRGLVVAQEVFADRTYQASGALTPRNQVGSVLDSETEVVAQALQMVQTGTVRATDGSDVKITADTICLHGDGPNAVKFASALRRELSAAGISMRPFDAAA